MGKFYHDSSLCIVLSKSTVHMYAKMYQSKSTIPYPGWIPAEALIPFSRNAFNKPWEKKTLNKNNNIIIQVILLY